MSAMLGLDFSQIVVILHQIISVALHGLERPEPIQILLRGFGERVSTQIRNCNCIRKGVLASGSLLFISSSIVLSVLMRSFKISDNMSGILPISCMCVDLGIRGPE